MKETITQLQETISHQGEDILRLSDELYTQQKETADLRLQLAKLQARFQEVMDDESGIRSIDQETPPPHY